MYDGVSREYGRDLHRNDVDIDMCKDVLPLGNISYEKCKRGETETILV